MLADRQQQQQQQQQRRRHHHTQQTAFTACVVATAAAAALVVVLTVLATPASGNMINKLPAGMPPEVMEALKQFGGGAPPPKKEEVVARPPRAAVDERPNRSAQMFLTSTRRLGAITTFKNWFKKHYGFIHGKVRLQAVLDAKWPGDIGVRIVATGKIAADDPLFVVPERLLLHKGLLQAADSANLTDHEALAVLLLDEVGQGKESFFHDYIELLPRKLNTPAFYKPAELALLRGSILEQHTHWWIAQLQESAKTIVKWAEKRRRYCGRLFTHDAAMWALGIVYSRSFTIEKRDNSHHLHHVPFLAPGADLLNHNIAAQVSWRLGESRGTAKKLYSAFEVATQQSYQGFLEAATERDVTELANDVEVFNHYHNFTNAQFLNLYGFVVAPNPHDVLPLTLSLPNDGTPMSHYKSYLIERWGLGTTVDLSIAQGVPVSLRNLARVLTLQQAYPDLPTLQFDPYVQDFRTSLPEELQSIVMIITALTELVQGYPTIDDWPQPLTPALQQAGLAVAGELQILQYCLSNLVAELQAYQALIQERQAAAQRAAEAAAREAAERAAAEQAQREANGEGEVPPAQSAEEQQQQQQEQEQRARQQMADQIESAQNQAQAAGAQPERSKRRLAQIAAELKMAYGATRVTEIKIGADAFAEDKLV